MTQDETRRYEMLLRVREFGEAHQDQFPLGSLGAQAFEDVTRVVNQLAEQATSKMAAVREGKQSKESAREALVTQLEAISRSARVIAIDSPGFNDAFHMPRPQTDRALVTAGLLFARQADAVKSRFVEYSMPASFVTTLEELVAEFDEAIRSREAGMADHITARARIQAALSDGMTAVRRLEVIVANQLRDDPAAMVLWERDRRIDRSRRRNVASAAATLVPPPAVAGPTQVTTSPGNEVLS